MSILADRELSPISKTIYSYLAVRCGEKYECWPSRKRILADLRISKKAYYRHLKPLISKGIVRIHKEKTKENLFTNNRFVLKDMEFGVDPGEIMVSTDNSDEAVLNMVAQQNPKEYGKVMRGL